MSNEADSLFDLIIDAFGYIGAWLHWLVLGGRKPFSKVRESEIINGIIGVVILITLFFLFKNMIFEFILAQFKETIKHH